MPKLFFEHEKTKKRFEIVRFNEADKTVTLKGPTSEFTDDYDKELYKKLGYKLVKEEEDA